MRIALFFLVIVTALGTQASERRSVEAVASPHADVSVFDPVPEASTTLALAEPRRLSVAPPAGALLLGCCGLLCLAGGRREAVAATRSARPSAQLAVA